MTIDEFKQLAEAWGADIARWPPHRHVEAEAVARTPAATAILEEAQRLDCLIAMSTPEIDADRINRASLNVATAIAADGDRTPVPGAFSGKVETGFPQKMRPNKESRARFRFNLTGTRSGSRFARWWLAPAASFACAAAAGIWLGVTLPLSSLQVSADAGNVLSVLLDNDSLELNWIER